VDCRTRDGQTHLNQNARFDDRLQKSDQSNAFKISLSKLRFSLVETREELFDSTFIAAIIAFVQAGVSFRNELFAYMS
jgi:hypothetical protein